MMSPELPVPAHFHPEKVGEVWKVSYQDIASVAQQWAFSHGIQPATNDATKVCLLVVDVQNTFCVPGFELYVGGRSGFGAVDDNKRLCDFIYRNLANITQIVATLDTHQAMQIFHSIFLVNDKGEHPNPYTIISLEDVVQGRWKFNRALCHYLDISSDYGQRYLEHYARRLRHSGKYELTIWPYHAMLGGIGHALVAAVEEAIFFHTIARYSQVDIHIKGNHPLTEHYSVLGPEVGTDIDNRPLTQQSDKVRGILRDYDVIIVTGQAKSHCVAWTIADLLTDILAQDRKLAAKVYLLEDCTSPVVVPGAVDYTDAADAAFQQFAEAGMHLVRAIEPMVSWPDLGNRL